MMTGTDFLLGRGAGVYINQEGRSKVTLGSPNPCGSCWPGSDGPWAGYKLFEDISTQHRGPLYAWGRGEAIVGCRRDGKTHQSQGRS